MKVLVVLSFLSMFFGCGYPDDDMSNTRQNPSVQSILKDYPKRQKGESHFDYQKRLAAYKASKAGQR